MLFVLRSIFKSAPRGRQFNKHPAVLPVDSLADRMKRRGTFSRGPGQGYCGIDTREVERFIPHHRTTVVRTGSGRRIRAWILNMSSVAVALQCDLTNLDVEDVKLVGSRAVVPGRKLLGGRVFMFEKPFRSRYFGPDVVL